MSGEALEEELAAMVGKPVGSREVATAPDPVNQPMIRHWAAAFEDWNPVYTDEARASASRFGGIVAPPLMLQTWTMATPLDRRDRRAGRIAGRRRRTADRWASWTRPGTGGRWPPIRSSRSSGTSGSARSSRRAPSSTSISEEKQTRLGPGRFVTWVTTYRNEAGEVVGRQTLPDPQIQAGRGAGLSDRTVPRDGASRAPPLTGTRSRSATSSRRWRSTSLRR